MVPLRRRLSVALPLFALCGLFAVVLEVEAITPWWRHAVVDFMWGLFSLGAALACLGTARRIPTPSLRRAWQFFGAGCFAWFLGIVEWTRLELYTGWLNPFPSAADAFFLAMPLLFVCGMASLRRERRTPTLSLLQASNVGLVMVGATVAITLALSPSFHLDDSARLENGVVAANVVLFTGDFLFGLHCLLLRRSSTGPKSVLLPIVLGQGLNWLVVLAYLRELLDSSYAVGGWLDVAFCLLFVLVILAAYEQRHQPDANREAPRPEQPTLSLLDSFFPTFALGFCMLASLPFLDSLGSVPAWLLAVEGSCLVGFLGLNNVVSRRLLGELERSLRGAELRAMEAQGLESMGTLASGLAHDFNNILAVIQGQVSLLRPSPDDAESMNAVEEAIAQGGLLTQSLHGLARHEGDTRRVADVRQLVHAVKRLAGSVHPAGIELRLDIEPQLPPIRVASSQIQHALLNLALNARDAMPAGGEITFGARVRGEGNGRRLELSVSDSGTGMEPEVAARAFEPFFTTKPAGRGTGLGLSMVAKAAQDHEGEVRVDSTRGRGTTVTMSLPLDLGADATSIVHLPVAAPVAGRHVLVVDDDSAIREVLERVFVSRGWKVTLAVDGVEALARFRTEGPFQAVVTDLDMPRLDGIRLTAQLRQERPDLPVVLISGNDHPPELALDGNGSVFRKPLDTEHLLAHLESLLKVVGARR